MDPKQTTQITQLLIRRRRSAILAADVAGYSALMGSDEERTLKRLDAARSIMDSRILQYGGRIANTAGDSVIAEFPKAVAAVRCAVEVQNALRQRNAGVPPAERLQFRIGINYGEVMANRADLLGDNVNVAARIENLAQPGGVLISASAHEQVYGRIEVGLRPLGEQVLKNINRKVVVYEVLLAGDAKAAAGKSAPPPRSTASARPARAAPPPERSRGAWPLVVALGLVVLLAIGAIAYLVATQLLPTRPQAPADGAASPSAPAAPAATGSEAAPAAAGSEAAPAAAQPRTAAATAGPDVARLAADANAALAGFTCARLRAEVSAPAAIAVSGYVGANADAQAAVARLAALPGAGPVTPHIAVMRPPLCQVLEVVPAAALFAAGDGSAPRLAVGGTDGVYHDGDNLVVSVTAPSGYDGYLYVDYVDGEENIVAHLLPNDLRPDNRVIAGQRIVIGKMPQEIVRYGIQPPYGTNLVLVLSTRRPLFDAPSSKWAKLPEFLPKFAAALQAQPDALVAYGTVVVAPR
jgi:class 3 adenylate cyclase